MTKITDPDTLIQSFRQAEKWLFTLITDPKGERYFQEKSMDVRMQEFIEQIERMRDFMGYCDNPEAAMPSIHVAGTSGKGSVVNLLAGIMGAGGLKIGYHVSPYLQVCTEKLVTGGRRIAPSEFVALVELFKEKYGGWLESGTEFEALKYGEAWVALTFLHMAQAQVDWAVIETGLGGRYDPTNVVPASLAVITNVNYDHMEVLGEELIAIAAHKAGIIKPGGTAITGETNSEVLGVLKHEAEVKEARLYVVGEDFFYSIDEREGEKSLTVRGVYDTYENLHIGMSGEFQYENAALAVAAVDVLRHEFGLSLTADQLADGLGKVRYPGRFEVVSEEPLVLLDGAHNRHKASALEASLVSEYPDKRFIIVLGTLSIKDFSGIVETLAPVAKLWVATQPRVFGKPSTPPDVLAEKIRSITPDLEVIQEDNVINAIERALSLAGEKDAVVVSGSLYMLGEARERWFSSLEILLADEEQLA